MILGEEVFYIDCTNIPLEHLELVVREVYLPLMCTNQSVMNNTGGDKVMDVLHRLMSTVEITQGHVEVSEYQKLNMMYKLVVYFPLMETKLFSDSGDNVQSNL